MTLRIREREDARSLVGTTLGRYEVCGELASGGMATVYLARAAGLGGFHKLVALKCVHAALARDRGFIEMFHDEARIASRIVHPNVCSVFDVGCAQGVHYLAMDYLDGETVASIMREAVRSGEVDDPRWPLLCAAIVAAACEGLHAAHELRGDDGAHLQVVHRDVSPQNVFVTRDGGVKVVDFGVARAAGRLHTTMSGVVKGKAAYMSPQQMLSEPIDRRADVWALGVTLWEMLAKRRLFKRAGPIETIRAVLDEPIVPPSVHAPTTPFELDAIVMTALCRDPDRRFSTARAMGRALRNALASRRQGVGPPELAEAMDRLFGADRSSHVAVATAARGGAAAAVHPADDPDHSSFATRSQTASFGLPMRRSAAVWLRRSMLIMPALVVLATVVVAASPADPPAAGPTPVPEPVSDDAPARLDPPVPVPAPAAPAAAAPTEPESSVVPSARRSPRAPGTLFVGYRGGWAEVWVDGERAGETPLSLVTAPGRRRIEVHPGTGGETERRDVRVRSGATARVVFGDGG